MERSAFHIDEVGWSVFASQAGYLVTIFGVIWGMVIFNEVHSGWVWSSLVVMLFGLSGFAKKGETNRLTVDINL